MPVANVGLTAQNFLRRNFWVFHLLFIAVSCYLAAGIATEFAAAALLKGAQKRPEAATAAATAATPSTRPVKPPSKISLMGTLAGHNIFDAEPIVVANAEGEKGSGPPLADLGIELLGTLVSSQREWSLATIRMQTASKLVREGLLIADRATVTEIASRYIILEDGTQRLVVRLWAEPGAAKPGAPKAPGPAAPAKAAVPGGEFAKGVKKTGAYDYQLDRSMLEENLQDLSKLGMQARIVPNYENGKYHGFRLVGIAPDSLYKAIGLESGDLLRRVGGKDLDSPNKAIELFDQLRTSSNITIDVERRGQKVSMNYQIK